MVLPQSWPEPSDDEVLPEVFLELPGSDWPPAGENTPAGTGEVADWSYTRQLVGNVLPGNVRVRSGLSIGEAKATLRQPSDAPRLSPWGAGDRRVAVGGVANLFASHSGASSSERVPLGSWQVDPVEGSALSPNLPVTLIESSYGARSLINRLPLNLESSVEPAWIVDTLLRQAGYYSTPAPIDSCILSVPMNGSSQVEVGLVAAVADEPPDGWNRSTGPLSPVGALEHVTLATESIMPSGESRFLTVNVVGTLRIELGYFYSDRAAIEIRPGGVLAVANNLGSGFTTGTYTPGLSPDHPFRVEIEYVRTLADEDTWDQLAARVRSAPDAAWSSWVTSTADADTHPESDDTAIFITASGSSFSAAQISRTSSLALWARPTADVDPLDGHVAAPWLPGVREGRPLDAWTGIQEVCAAYLGAAWVRNDGVAMVRNRHYMAGLGDVVETIDVELSAQDITWVLDPADTADRVEATYYPAERTDFFETPDEAIPVLWEATEVISLGPHETRTIVVDLPFWANPDQFWQNDPEIGRSSIWIAHPNRDGSGTAVDIEDLFLQTRLVSAGRATITMQNLTNSTVYFVDSEGQPYMKLRPYQWASQATAALLEQGATAEAARNPLTVDLTWHVQNAEDATELANYVWSRVSRPTPRINGIRVKVDWTRDIGQIIRISDTDTGLSSKALIVGINMTGTPAEVAQVIDVVLLPPIWTDFDAAWAGKTWDDFDTHWSARTWNAFDQSPIES